MQQIEHDLQTFDLDDYMLKAIPKEQDRIKYVMNYMHYKEFPKIIQELKPTEKSSISAKLFRTNGNQFFTSKQNTSLNKAMEEYSKSIAYSLPESQELAIAYGNRSAVFYKANLFHECIIEIERALQNNYPDELKTKLFFRKALCLKAINPENKDSFQKAYNKAKKMLDKMNTSHQNFMKEKMKNYEMPIFFNNLPAKKWKEILPMLDAENPMIPGLSDAVALNYSDEFGRHIVSTRNINPGEILALQKIHTKIIMLDQRYKVCWHCGEQTWAGIPCKDCVYIIFCSEQCREEAQLHYHDIECKIFGFMITSSNIFNESGIFSLRLTIKALKEVGGCLETLKDNLNKIDAETDVLTKGFTNGILDPVNFSSIYGLISNQQYYGSKYVRRLLTSVLSVYLLVTKTDFLKQKMSNDLKVLKNNELFIFLAGLFLKNYETTSRNAFSLTKSHKKLKEIEHVKLIGAIIPAFSFFNHSCSLMVFQIVHGDYTALYSMEPIKKGSQIFMNYSSVYTESPKEFRQKELYEHYHFTCKCDACNFNWPCNPILSNTMNIDSKILLQLSNAMKNFHATEEMLCSVPRTKNLVIDVKKNIVEMTKIIKYLCIHVPRNDSMLESAINLLAGYFTITANRYLSLD